MTEGPDAAVSSHTLLDMLGIALVEIRATENLTLARALADVFHNAPARIARNIDPIEILQDIRMRAAMCGQEEYIERLLKHVLDRA